MVRELPAALLPRRTPRPKANSRVVPPVLAILEPMASRVGADAETSDNQPNTPDKPAFDRTAYQKAYMKAYMRKKRAGDKAVKT